MSDHQYDTSDNGPDIGFVPEGAPPERELTARERVMASAVERREQQILAESEGGNDRSDEQPPEFDSAVRPANPSLGEREEDRQYNADRENDGAAPRQPAPSRRQVDHEQSQPPLFPINLDGQQVFVTQDQMAHLAQMGAIATQALQQYNSQPQQYHQPAQPHAPAPGLREVVRNLQYSDEETAAAAVESHFQERDRRISQEIRAELQKESLNRVVSDATPIIQQEYADILADPIRADAAARQVAMLRQQYGTDPTLQLAIFREAGNRVRQSFGTGARQSVQQGGIRVSRDEAGITERKRSAPSRTSAVIDRRSGMSAPQEERRQSGSSIVAAMRAARGQR